MPQPHTGKRKQRRRVESGKDERDGAAYAMQVKPKTGRPGKAEINGGAREREL